MLKNYLFSKLIYHVSIQLNVKYAFVEINLECWKWKMCSHCADLVCVWGNWCIAVKQNILYSFLSE